MKYSHDPKADAIYITLSDKAYAFGEELNTERRIDYSEDGTPIGIELTGVDLRDLPAGSDIGKLLSQRNIRILAA